MVGDKIAIVDDLPGVTRDRLYRDTEWSGSEFVIVDTGGLEPRNNDFLMAKIKEQAEVAMNEADVILFVVDGKAGLNPLDEEIARCEPSGTQPGALCRRLCGKGRTKSTRRRCGFPWRERVLNQTCAVIPC